MLIYAFLFVMIIYLSVILWRRNNDLLFPSSVVLLVFILSTCLAISESEKWDMSISSDTFLILCAGLFVYTIVSLVCSNLKPVRFTLGNYAGGNYNSHDDVIDKNHGDSVVSLNWFVYLLMICFDIIILIKYYIDVRNSSLSVGSFLSFGEMIGNYRSAGLSGELEIGISKISTYGFMIMTAFAFICAYILMQSFALREKTTLFWKLKNILPVLLYCVCSLFTGGRNPILQMICALVTFYFVFKFKYNPKQRIFNFKTIIRLTLIGIIVLYGFSYFRGIVGRTNDYDIYDYIALYLGAPIKLFDLFVQDLDNTSKIVWGQETFINLWKWVGRIIGNKELSGLVMNKAWRSINGYSLGNVYTAFREYMSDFGVQGVLIMVGIHSAIFSTWYASILRIPTIRLEGRISNSILLYGYVAQSLFYYSVDDRFFQAFLSRSNFITVFIMLFFVAVLPRLKFTIKKEVHYGTNIYEKSNAD